MASIPQAQITEAYHQIKYDSVGEVYFGRGYVMTKNGPVIKLKHYGTFIYECNLNNGTFKVGGWSRSDADAINSIAYWTGIGGAYIQNYTLYPKRKGPRYEKKPRAVRRK